MAAQFHKMEVEFLINPLHQSSIPTPLSHPENYNHSMPIFAVETVGIRPSIQDSSQFNEYSEMEF